MKLTVGDVVSHAIGVGRVACVSALSIMGEKIECHEIRFRGGQKIYVPVDRDAENLSLLPSQEIVARVEHALRTPPKMRRFRNSTAARKAAQAALDSNDLVHIATLLKFVSLSASRTAGSFRMRWTGERSRLMRVLAENLAAIRDENVAEAEARILALLDGRDPDAPLANGTGVAPEAEPEAEPELAGLTAST